MNIYYTTTSKYHPFATSAYRSYRVSTSQGTPCWYCKIFCKQMFIFSWLLPLLIFRLHQSLMGVVLSVYIAGTFPLYLCKGVYCLASNRIKSNTLWTHIFLKQGTLLLLGAKTCKLDIPIDIYNQFTKFITIFFFFSIIDRNARYAGWRHDEPGGCC